MSWLRTTTASVVVLAGVAWGTPPDPEDVFERAARQGNTAAMVEAAERLAAAPSEDGTEVLVEYGALVEDFAVYQAALGALRAAREQDESLEEIIKGLERSRRFEAKVLCADALAGFDNEDAVEALGEALEAREGPVRIAAIRALQTTATRAVVPMLFGRLGELDMDSADAEVEELYTALLALTGQSYETLADWENYWAGVPADFDPRQRNRGGGDEVTTRTRSSQGRIFGSEVRSQRFVLCLDISTSMRVIDLPGNETETNDNGNPVGYRDPGVNRAPDPESRFERARAQFCEFIGGLSRSTQFAIVVFGASPETRLWQPRLVPATPRSKEQAIAWVQGLQWSGGTRTDLALEQAFSVEGADTIYMFSDGIPERAGAGGTQRIPEAEVLGLAQTLNRVRKVRINVYGFARVSRSTKEFLERLASENGGEYQDIAAQ